MIHTVGHLSGNKTIAKRVVAFFLSTFMIFTFSACADIGNESAMDVFQADSIIGVLGIDKTQLPETLTLDDANSYKSTYDNVPVEIKYEFEEDKLLRIQYNFGTETDTAFKFINETMSTFEQKYGKSDTYETLPNRIEGLTVNEYLANDTMQYQEYWIDSDVDFKGLVPEEYKDTKRVDLGIGINKLPADDPITIVYIGWIINSANTQKLSD